MLPIIQKHSSMMSQNQEKSPIIVPPGIVSRKTTGMSRHNMNSKLSQPDRFVCFSMMFFYLLYAVICSVADRNTMPHVRSLRHLPSMPPSVSRRQAAAGQRASPLVRFPIWGRLEQLEVWIRVRLPTSFRVYRVVVFLALFSCFNGRMAST